jgi:hypothetical protein
MTHKRVYNVNQDDVKASLDVMTGIITLNSLKKIDFLLDPRATHSFVSYKFIIQLNITKCELNKGLDISTHLEEMIDINDMYKEHIILVGG